MQDRLGNKVRLLHIIDAINEIENYVQDSDLETFAANSMMFNATLRQLEIIGEASNRLSEDLLNENSTIPGQELLDFVILLSTNILVLMTLPFGM
jgi:uncharacterized protein with HEPN domain